MVLRTAVGASIIAVLVAGSAVRADTHWAPPVFDVPQLRDIVVDGRAGDWGDRGLRVEALCATQPMPTSAADFSARARLGWCDDGLLALVTVQDDVPNEEPNDFMLWARDCVEMSLAAEPGGDQFQVIISPGVDPEHPAPRVRAYDQRKNAELRRAALSATAAAARSEGGYTVEALLPWRDLGLRPALGAQVGFQFTVRDFDSDLDNVVYPWYPLLGTSGDSSRVQRLRMSTGPSAPVRVAAAGWYERFRRTQVRVTATRGLAGQRVTLREGGVSLVSAALHEAGGRSEALLTLPMPPWGRPYAPIDVAINREPCAFVILPNADQERREALRDADLLAQPFVFSGTALPSCDFAEPSLVEDLAGPYSIRTTYYARDFRPVTSADSPGRYGAVVEVETRDAGRVKRYVTLFRTEGDLPWRSADWPFTVGFPAELGIPADVTRDQPAAVNAGLTELTRNGFRRDPVTAVLLASLHEAGIAPGTSASAGTPLGGRIWAADQRWRYGLRKQLGDLVPLKYLLFVPEAYRPDAKDSWPLLLFLHGAGERGDNLELVRVHGPPKIVQTKPGFPFILVSPQCPVGEWWSPWLVRDLLDEVCSRYRVDRARMYVTGLSMGGYGTWDVITEFPGLFAAAVPICGGGDPASAAAIGSVPVWAFHGGKDSVVPLRESEDMVKALQALGSPAKLTVYPNADHDSWTETYNNPELYTWLLAQRR